MKEQPQNIDLTGIRTVLNVPDSQSIDDSFFYVNWKYGQSDSPSNLTEPYHTKGYLAFFCTSGHFDLEVNLNTIHVRQNSLVVVVPGSICHINTSDTELKENNTSIVLLAASDEFLSSMRYDFNRMFKESVTILDLPAITVDEESFAICKDYFHLTESLCQSAMPRKKEAMRLLISSAFAYLGELWTRNLHQAKQNISTRKGGSRAQLVFDNFISLVQEYHHKERGMAFYADRLCLTPKYLSKLVRNVSGRSAPDWIDAFVIMEAQNMLKYSNRPIKEIVYLLNFPNQSVFYKYFKAHTGMTPSEYRES